MYSLILTRLALSGLFILAILGSRLILRLFKLDMPTGDQRRRFWQYLLILSLIPLIWPRVIYYPLQLPSWLFTLQVFNRTGLLSAIFLPGMPATEKLIRTGRLLMPAGAIIYIVIKNRMLWESKNPLLKLQKMKSREEAEREARNLDETAWYQYLALWRDRLGYYRQGEIRLLPESADNLRVRIRNWYRGIMPVSSQKPPAADNAEKISEGALILDKLQHPDIITYLLYETIRIVYWFVPVWWFSGRLFHQDLRTARNARINEKLARSVNNKQKQVLLRQITRKITCMLIMISIGLIYIWQQPAIYLPDLKSAAGKMPQANFGLQIVMTERFHQIYTDQEDSGDYRLLFNSDVPVLYLRDGDVHLEKIRQDGTLDWQTILPLDTVVSVVSYIPQIISIELIESRILPGDELHLLCATVNDLNIGHYWHIRLKADGELISVYQIEKQATEVFTDYSLCLTADGGYLAYAYDEHLHLWRFDQQGKLIWQKQDTDIFRDQAGTPVKIRVLADNNGGFYLLITAPADADNIHIYDRDILCTMLYHLDKLGNVGFTVRLDDNDRSYLFTDGAVDTADRLYLGGQVRFTAADYLEATGTADPAIRSEDQICRDWTSGLIIAIEPDGKIIWLKYLPIGSRSYIREILLQEETITVTHIDCAQAGTENRQFIRQLDLAGNITAGRTIINEKRVYVRPGTIYVQMPEPLDPDLVS